MMACHSWNERRVELSGLLLPALTRHKLPWHRFQGP